MLTEQQVRTRIKACKEKIKIDKVNVGEFISYQTWLLAKSDLRYQKAKLKLLRRELPMKLIKEHKEYHGQPIEILNCPICKILITSYGYKYCPHCGQRVRE